jgi:hypothetical protein
MLSLPGVNVLSLEDTMSLFGVLRSWSKSSSSLPSRIEALDPKSSSAAIPKTKTLPIFRSSDGIQGIM